MSWLRRSGIQNDEKNSSDPDDVANSKATPVIENERGIPSVNQRSFRSKAMPMTVAAMALTVAGVIWLVPGPEVAPKKQKDDPRATIDERFDESTNSTAILAPAKPSAPAAPPSATPTSNDPPISVIPAPEGQVAYGKTSSYPSSTNAKRPLTQFELRQASQPTIGGTNRGAAPDSASQEREQPPIQPPAPHNNPAAPAPQNAPPESAEGSQPASSGPLAEALKPTKFKGVSASHIPDRTFTIAQGAMMHCTLDTAISSTQPGMTKCTMDRHVYGDDGKVILLDRGTELIGQYQGSLRHGQARLFVLWTRAKTPRGVIIDLVSPGTDTLGRSGLSGEVDKHFFDRFGSAMLLSIVDDAAGMIAARSQNNNGNGNTILYPSNTASTSKDAAAIAVESSINIPPTLTKNQGEHVSVFVARDLDFRQVYSLQVANDR